MDLALFFRVLWRFKVIVLLGLSLAFALAFLSYVKVDIDKGFKLTYRENAQWESLSTPSSPIRASRSARPATEGREIEMQPQRSFSACSP